MEVTRSGPPRAKEVIHDHALAPGVGAGVRDASRDPTRWGVLTPGDERKIGQK